MLEKNGEILARGIYSLNQNKRKNVISVGF